MEGGGPRPPPSIAPPPAIGGGEAMSTNVERKEEEERMPNLGLQKRKTGLGKSVHAQDGGGFVMKTELQQRSRNTTVKRATRMKTIVRSIKPTVRRAGEIKVTSAAKRARFQKPRRGEREDRLPALQAFFSDGKHVARMVQLGQSFFIALPGDFLECVGQLESKVHLYLTNKTAKAQMKWLEDAAEEGVVNKQSAEAVCLGELCKVELLSDSAKAALKSALEQKQSKKRKGDNNAESGEEDEQEREFNIDLDFIETNCFELDNSFPPLALDALSWTGLVVAKKADDLPASAYVSILMYANLEPVKEDEAPDKKVVKQRRKELAEVQKRVSEEGAWVKGQGLAAIRKILKPKLRYFDRDSSGTIDFGEFSGIMENLGMYLTEARLQRLFQACDLDRSGEVELEELPLAIHINDQLTEKPYMTPRDAFELFDYDGSGELNEHEFFEVIQLMAVAPMSREQCTKLFQKVDKDDSGLIDYEEFREVWLELCDPEHELNVRAVARGELSMDQIEAKNKKFKFPLLRARSRLTNRRKLRQIVIKEEEEEEAAFAAAVERCCNDQRELRIKNDQKSAEAKKVRRREALAARVAVSKAERELRRQRRLELAQRKRIESKEKTLREQLTHEKRYREERERLQHKQEREFKEQQEKEARARRGDDRLEKPEMGLREIPKEWYAGKEKQKNIAYFVSVDLSRNKLEKLPDTGFFFWCSSLRRLLLNDNRLSSLPAEVESLENVQLFDLSRNRLKSLVPQIGRLSNLTYLNLGENELVSLPEEIEGLATSLHTLALYRNALNLLPDGIGKLSKLVVLDLSLNALTELPESLEKLESLRRLDLSWNKIQKFPRSIGQIATLETLDLSGNELRRLPNAFEGLGALRALNLGRNDLMELPPSVGYLASLLKLDASHNRIIRLPDEVGNLPNLQILELSSNRIKTLPQTLGKLRRLLVLNLQGNILDELPSEIGAISHLQRINVAHNHIKGKLPASLGSLRDLAELNLSFNEIEELPISMGALQALRVLNLGHNVLTFLPSSIGCLGNLEEFNLSCNSLEELPDSIGHLGDTLVDLDLSGNRLVWLPETIGQLSVLERLDLHHNRLRAVPAELGKVIPHLEKFSVTHNPLFELPPRFGSDVKCKDAAQLLWSGYSDGQVADYITEISDVFEMCQNVIVEKDLLAPEKDQVDEGKYDEAKTDEHQQNERQTLHEFLTTVKSRMVENGTWREHLSRHASNFFFRARAIGAVPRMASLYGADLHNYNNKVEIRKSQKKQMCVEVKDLPEEKIERIERTYAVTRAQLIKTQNKLQARAEAIRDKRRKETRELYQEAGKACFQRQEQIYLETQRRRERERRQELQRWREKFIDERSHHLDMLKIQHEYVEVDDSWMYQ